MATEMGYQAPGSQAASKTAVNIGVLVQERYLGNGSSFYWRLYQELAVACAAHNCLLAFCVLKPDEEKNIEIPVMISDHRVDGLIVMGEISRAYLRKLEKEAGMPMIFLDFYAAEFDVDCVISNNFYGMYTATRHLVKKGHKKIAYVGSGTRLSARCSALLSTADLSFSCNSEKLYRRARGNSEASLKQRNVQKCIYLWHPGNG